MSHLIHINVDVTNPGQYFACCGLLELAERLSPGAQGWFEPGAFFIDSLFGLRELIERFLAADLVQVDKSDTTASPIFINDPFSLRLDWWKSSDRTITDLKVWAGTMESYRIANAMKRAMKESIFFGKDLLNAGTIAYDPDDPTKKVEPYYFDARRAPNANSRDVGFAPNDLGMTTTAFPSVELFCLIGLQRCKPVPEPDRPRIFNYYIWSSPLEAALLPAAVAGLLPRSKGYQFESFYRTSQKKHKAFQSAKPITTH